MGYTLYKIHNYHPIELINQQYRSGLHILRIINLFPIPILDGGHLLFYAIEAVRGKPLGERTQEIGFRIGLAFVLVLMIFVTVNDLEQRHIFDFLKF